MKRRTSGFWKCLALAGFFSLLSGAASAAQPETLVDCDEGVIAEPVAINYGDSTNGCEVSPATDLDRFTFSGTAGDVVRINIDSNTNGLDPFLEIRDPSGTVVTDTSCSAAFNTVCSVSLDIALAQSGSYFLSLSDVGNNESGSYRLSVWCLSGNCPTAAVLAYDVAELDRVDPTVDADFYQFNGTAGTSLRLNIDSNTNGLDPVIEVRDPTGATVLDGVADGANCEAAFNTTCSFSIDLAPTMSGAYSLVIYDRATNEFGDYQLSLWCLAGNCQSIAGTDDPLPPRLSYVLPVLDEITPGVDGDFYRINGTAGTSLRFNVDSITNGLDPVIEVRDPTGALVIDGIADSANCEAAFNTTCSFSVDLDPALSGDYSLLIYDLGTNETGNYYLSVWCILGDCDSDADDFVDGDRQIVDYGESVTTAVDQPVDGDFYAFQGTAGDQIRLSVNGLTNGLDPTIEVIDPNGLRILNGAADGAGCTAAFNTTCSFSVDVLPSITGTYQLAFYDLGVNEGGSYQLGLQCLFGTCSNLTPPLVCGDNCSVQPNPNQIDSSGDGIGNVCDADLNDDGFVNFADLALFKQCFGTTEPDCDFVVNGFVNFADLSAFKRLFGGEPGPSCAVPNSP